MSATTASFEIFGDVASGNCLKVKYTADYLRLPYRWHEIDIMKGESRTANFLRMNPQGQVPVVRFADGRCLAQSNAVMRYLAAGSALLPEDAYLQAKVDEWLFWEQNSHEFFVAGCRFHMVYLGKSKETRDPARVERGEQALGFMNQQLAGKDWLAAGQFTIADIALLAYTRLAHEGGFDMALHPHVQAWIARCERELALDAAATRQLA